jgi:hypothetical protein
MYNNNIQTSFASCELVEHLWAVVFDFANTGSSKSLMIPDSDYGYLPGTCILSPVIIASVVL